MKLTEVKAIGNYDVLVTYANGEQRIFHGRDLWKSRKRFRPLRDLEFFNRVEIYECQHTIGWPGPDDLQISPEWLWEWSTPVSKTSVA